MKKGLELPCRLNVHRWNCAYIFSFGIQRVSNEKNRKYCQTLQEYIFSYPFWFWDKINLELQNETETNLLFWSWSEVKSPPVYYWTFQRQADTRKQPVIWTIKSQNCIKWGFPCCSVTIRWPEQKSRHIAIVTKAIWP